MRELVNKGAELLGWCLSGKDGDPAAVAHAQRGCDGFLELKLDALGGGEVDQAFAVLANFAGGALGELRKLCAFGLRNIEDVHGPESHQDGCVDCCGVFAALGFCVFLPAAADHRGQDADALLSLHHLASKLVPRIEASNAGCVRLLPCDFKDVAEAVVVESAHSGEVGGKPFAVSCFQLLDRGA